MRLLPVLRLTVSITVAVHFALGTHGHATPDLFARIGATHALVFAVKGKKVNRDVSWRSLHMLLIGQCTSLFHPVCAENEVCVVEINIAIHSL